MPSPRAYQTEAIIIKKTKLGEADSILTLYTPELGKIQGFARSLRKPKSRLAGHLELLTHSLVSLAHGRNIDTITGSQTIDSFLPLKSDLDLTSHALYVIEMINQFTPEHSENRLLFQLLLDTLQQLCQAENNEVILRYFELHLLHQEGYRPQLQQCVVCRQPLQPIANYFCSSAGGMICPDCQRHQPSVLVSLNALKVLRLLQGCDYATAIRLKLTTELSNELEGIMRDYLKYLLEKELKSIAWLDEMKGQGLANREPVSG